MPRRLRGSRNQRAFRRGGAALSEKFEEGAELVVRTISGGLGRGSATACECLFLEAQICLDVHLRHFDGLMPEPEVTDFISGFRKLAGGQHHLARGGQSDC